MPAIQDGARTAGKCGSSVMEPRPGGANRSYWCPAEGRLWETMCAGKSWLLSGVRPPAGDPEETGDPERRHGCRRPGRRSPGASTYMQHITEMRSFHLEGSTGRSSVASPELRPALEQHDLFPMNCACNRSEDSRHNDGQDEKMGWPRKWSISGARPDVGDTGRAELNRDLSQESTLDTILQVIQASQEALEWKIDTLIVDLTLFRDDHLRLTD
ncbi:hypothetical protein NDU88_003426 [Pleurodeles waltl]|uniref:Uncharacterized protein n=1 Tax=Pleurodeles waltl TaxID=8319 RepID=A0AAV7UE11_PLEWA|nr:hypothetical protein NDU88_003426 [Pleurodeles waltl]